MDIPNKISVLGTEFTIKVEAMKHGELGDFDYEKRLIRIHKGIKDPAITESALLHEIIHASLTVAGINQLIKEDLEEALVWALEHSLTNLYQRKS